MPVYTGYFAPGYVENAPNHNAVETFDTDANLYTRFDATGAVVEQRPLRPIEQNAFQLPAAMPANAGALRTKLTQALTVNGAFLANNTPTNADVVAQTRAVTRELNGVIRLISGQLADISDT